MDFKLNNVVSMWKVREMVDKATNLVMNYTETESKVILVCFLENVCHYQVNFVFCCKYAIAMYTNIKFKVRDATNDDPWGPSGVYQVSSL